MGLKNNDWGKEVADEIKKAAEKYTFIREILDGGRDFEELKKEIRNEVVKNF